MEKTPKKDRGYTVESLNLTDADRIKAVVENMSENRTFTLLPESEQTPETLTALKQKYVDYRHNWRHLPEKMIHDFQNATAVTPLPYMPLCVDIEIAAICDLACPFCYRQH